jgi:isoleucyl-tRNA synthetase
MLENMANARALITEGLAQRAAAGIKVRQPLARATVKGLEMSPGLQQIMADELNVKEISNQEGGAVSILMDTALTDELKAEGLARDLIRSVQSARKSAGFNVDDRIHLRLESNSKEVNEAIEQFKDTILGETLSTGELTGKGEHTEGAKIDGHSVQIHLSRT